MLHSQISVDLETLAREVSNQAKSVEDNGAFPSHAFNVLAAAKLTSRPPVAPGDIAALLALLVAVGRGDLSTGRIFEGHVNAYWLVQNYGSQKQRHDVKKVVEGAGLLGVWNTDAPGDPLHLEDGVLWGKKNFASGVDGLSHAVVTVTIEGGRQMLLVPLAGLPVDRSWWQPVGMKASGSHIVDFTRVPVSADMLIGKPDDYIAQPWFSAGAVRFLAVQLGGMHALFDIARDHLVSTNRCDNPYQAHRLARMGAAVETGYLWIDRLAAAWLEAETDTSPDTAPYLKAGVNGARLVIEAAAMQILDDAEQAIGAAGMIAPHPFERQMRDLRTYLRQPNPDGAAAQFGQSIAEAAWLPGQKSAKATARVA